MRQFGAAVGCEGRKMWGWMDGSNEAREVRLSEGDGRGRDGGKLPLALPCVCKIKRAGTKKLFFLCNIV